MRYWSVSLRGYSPFGSLVGADSELVLMSGTMSLSMAERVELSQRATSQAWRAVDARRTRPILLLGACGARRMVESAALLVDEGLPEAPMRQWVLRVPFA